MMPVGEKDDRQSIHEMVNSIPAVIEFEPEPQPVSLAAMSSKQIKKHLRSLLVVVQGSQWRGCVIDEHTMTNGQVLYTAARVCMRCQTIHTFVATIGPDGSFDFCAPLEDE